MARYQINMAFIFNITFCVIKGFYLFCSLVNCTVFKLHLMISEDAVYDVAQGSWRYLFTRLLLKEKLSKIIQLTISPQIIIQNLEQREAVPSIRRLFRQYPVHIHREQRPEDLSMLY